MDTNKIKKFAIEARNVLKQGIAVKLTTLGFDKKGDVSEKMFPTLVQGGSVWNGRTETEGFYHRWMSLYNRIRQKGVNEVYEEAAYTWFNRLIAIRILQKNHLIEPVLVFADKARTPRIVDEARSGRIPRMSEDVRSHLMTLLDDDTKTTEQFALLITAWCHQNPIIEKCFGSIADYTELLLPNNILVEGGFLDMLNHTEFITDDDFKSPELIGWLYQFYISERKDEVFAKKGKFEADEIPAATQIFTPNWIVKYMVENTLGRIYLDNNPYATEFKDKWKYLVEGEPTPEDSKYCYEELTDLKVADLACGSGHILNECFDILYDLYIAEGYSRSEAIENIFRYNLTGIDLDKRAQQLATFALLLKASQKDGSYADAHVLPFILTMPKPWDEKKNGDLLAAITEFFRGCETPAMSNDLKSAFELMKDADSLGSIMKFDISEGTRFALKQAVEYWEKEHFVPEVVSELMPSIWVILALTEKYSAVVMNPPYMKSGNMNEELKKYVVKNYPKSKADLFAVFMETGMQLCEKQGRMGMINMHSWMFLSSFETLRKEVIENYYIENMLHLGARTFDELSGEVVQNTAFVLKNTTENKHGVYYRLVDGGNCNTKKQLFLNGENRFSHISQFNFEKIPGSPIAYWVSRERIKTFNNQTFADIILIDGQNKTGNNDKFLRFLWEVDLNNIGMNKKYIQYAKGGTFRKWYGNIEYCIQWDEISRAFYKKDKIARIIKDEYWFKKGFTFSRLSSTVNCRILDDKGTFDATTISFFLNDDDKYLYQYCLAFFNTKVFDSYVKILNPTLVFQIIDVKHTPFIKSNIDLKQIEENISISQLDWDAHETSWDFQSNELIKQQKATIEEAYQNYLHYWTEQFHQLHTNEVELNRIFIDMYGLQDELAPEVPLEEITILQQGEIKIKDNTLEFQADAVIKQLLSYAIGCWMGRYRLDEPGLYIAHPDVKEDEIVTYPYGDETLTIDDDGIIPILPYECPFDDNLQTRIADFVRIAFGDNSLAENLNFIEQCLGTTIEKYLDKEYWKDHKKMYQNRPIYWLWSSKKGAFRCISYMHRMDAYTAERVRSKYLLPYIEYLRNKIGDLEARAAQLSVIESRKLDALRKALDECSEYHERLQVVAEQAIAFDLDDGVVVNYAKFGDVLAKIK